MCKYQRILDRGLPFCIVISKLCDLCVYDTQNHLKEGEKKDEDEYEFGPRDADCESQ